MSVTHIPMVEETHPKIQATALSFFPTILKDIKKRLPKTCTFLSPIKTTEGEYQVRAIIKGEEVRISTPDTLVFTKEDIEELDTVLFSKC